MCLVSAVSLKSAVSARAVCGVYNVSRDPERLQTPETRALQTLVIGNTVEINFILYITSMLIAKVCCFSGYTATLYS